MCFTSAFSRFYVLILFIRELLITMHHHCNFSRQISISVEVAVWCEDHCVERI